MPRKYGLSEGVQGGILGNMGSLFSGGVVVGLALVFGGPFITVLAVVSSIVYSTSLALRFLTPKKDRTNLKDWG